MLLPGESEWLESEGASHSDRSRSPSETLRLIAPYLARFGITRLARQTGLDELGIPVWAAFRPNSRSIAVNQGKGIGDVWARASAAMEAIEYAVAENPSASSIRATQDELEHCGRSVFDPTRLLSAGSVLPMDKPFDWLCGETLDSHRPIYVHRTVCCLDGAPVLPGLCQNTNGLASGNDLSEALFHGLCELIERDAVSLWAFTGHADRMRQCVSPDAFSDPVVSRLVKAIEISGSELRLFALTTDITVCTVSAVIRQRAERTDTFNFAAGSGCHPVPSRAAIRALTEAAQSRISTIAATRDDISPSDYRARAMPDVATLFEAKPRLIELPGLIPGTPLPELLDYAIDQAGKAGGDDIVAVRLDSGDMPFSVVRLLSRTLEDWDVNRNWRPGWRLLLAAA